VTEYLFCICLTYYSRPSTPIAEVIQHHYAAKWLETIQDKRTSLKKGQSPKVVIRMNHTYFTLFFGIRILQKVNIIQKHHFFVTLKFPWNQNHYEKCRTLLM